VLWKRSTIRKRFEREEKINKLFTSLGSVCKVKNCDLGLENAVLGLQPWAAFPRPSKVTVSHYMGFPARK